MVARRHCDPTTKDRSSHPPPHTPPLKKSRVGVKTKGVAKRKCGTGGGVKTKCIAKRKNGKYLHSHDKWKKLHTKMREGNLREEGLIRGMADILRNALPNYTAKRQPKHK
jgi:hypothetical protein